MYPGSKQGDYLQQNNQFNILSSTSNHTNVDLPARYTKQR